jgi:hypothetical protein
VQEPVHELSKLDGWKKNGNAEGKRTRRAIRAPESDWLATQIDVCPLVNLFESEQIL